MRHMRGAIVEKVESRKTHRTGVIRLDKRSMEFWARADDTDTTQEPFVSKDGREVRAWLLKQLDRTSEADRLEWIPVVQVSYGGESSHRYREDHTTGHSLKVEMDRYWLALTHDKREWRKLPWDSCDPDSPVVVPENDRYAASRRYAEGPASQSLGENTKAFRLPSFKSSYYSGRDTVLEYTPELWKGLLAVIEAIKTARGTIEQMLGTKQGVAVVAEIGAGKAQLLLQSGKSA